MKKENIAIIEMLVCATLWSIAGIFIKLIPWNGFAISGFRSLVAGTVIAIFMLITRRRFVFSRKTLLAGVLSACVYTCFVCSNKLTTAANAIVLQFTCPVFIVVFTALIQKTRIRRQDMLVVIFTLLGIALCFLDQLRPGYMLGNLVAVAAGMFMAGMFMAVGDLEADQRYSGVLIGQALTFLIGLPFIIATRPVFTMTATLSILALGIFQLGISYILYVKSSKYCPPLACCLLSAVEPMLNPVWVAIFDGERPGLLALIGAVVVVVSVTLWCVFGQKKPEKAAAEV